MDLMDYCKQTRIEFLQQELIKSMETIANNLQYNIGEMPREKAIRIQLKNNSRNVNLKGSALNQ